MIYLASLTRETKDKLEGYSFISTKDELDKVVADNKQFSTVTITSGFATEYFTPLGLQEYIQNARALNGNLIIKLDAATESMTEARIIEKLHDVRDVEELTYLATKYPKEVLGTIKELTTVNLEHKNELLEAENSVSRLQTIVDKLNSEVDSLREQLSAEQNNKFWIESKFNTLIKRINYQADTQVDPKYIFEVAGNRFDKVLYFKEITRVQYMDTFLYFLKEILKIVHNVPTRTTVIESYYSANKADLYKSFVPHHKLREIDVMAGDILMFGFQPNLMSDILKNASGVAILIILDRGGYKVPHLHGENVEYFYTVSDLKDAPEDIPKSRIISYSQDTLFIPHIDGYDKEERHVQMSQYSSMGIMKKMIALVGGR